MACCSSCNDLLLATTAFCRSTASWACSSATLCFSSRSASRDEAALRSTAASAAAAFSSSNQPDPAAEACSLDLSSASSCRSRSAISVPNSPRAVSAEAVAATSSSTSLCSSLHCTAIDATTAFVAASSSSPAFSAARNRSRSELCCCKVRDQRALLWKSSASLASACLSSSWSLETSLFTSCSACWTIVIRLTTAASSAESSSRLSTTARTRCDICPARSRCLLWLSSAAAVSAAMSSLCRRSVSNSACRPLRLSSEAAKRCFAAEVTSVRMESDRRL
mmetsp:Transcript_7503/g.13291  ORF Transcript_7503/g.13291 Transcript_7503/m.13291 type:complete len:279 (+) Transcript_7503:1097-1933(+)